MSTYFISIGLFITCYTLAAYLFGFPQLSDFFPVDFFDEKLDSKYYKIVATDSPDKGPWFVIGLGLVFIVLGLSTKYVF